MALTRDSDMPIIAGDGFLAEESKDKVQFVDAKCPIFEGVKSRQLRALMMVAMGCDVYKPCH